MHIDGVVLEGFKSYAERTEIKTFDRHFNAITGLNGSGKSNILDGIIFVLGLSSLSTVRAQTLQDLVHKSSTKAPKTSCAIIFDNSDKRPGKCPPGHEHFEKIVVSRTIEAGLVCKYFLNGKLASKKLVQEMFESVHLNISNPNFMIMQGKITKVVNMKPKELLHMIEETVGALSYQNKRDKSCKEIEEKDRQLISTNLMLEEVVRPAISRQLKAARLIDEYKYARTKLDKFAEEYVFTSYTQHTAELETYTTKLEKLESHDKSDDGRVVELKGSIQTKKQEQDEIQKNSEAKVKEKLTKLEKIKGAERKKLAGIEAQFEAANESVEDANGKVRNAEKSHKEELKQMEDYKKKSSNLLEEFNSIKEDIQTAKDSLKQAKDQENELNSGKILGDDGKAINLRERLINVEDEIGKIRPSYEHESKIHTNESKNLKLKELELSKTPSDAQIEKEFKATEAEVTKIKKILVQKKIYPEEYPVVERRVEELKGTHHKLQKEIRDLTRNYPYLIFNYKEPPNFNRNSVHGCFFELFKIKDLETHKKALEVAVGGSLTHVVVDTPNNSAELINKGDLARRTTFMPLSTLKDRGRAVNQEELDRKLGRNKAIPAFNCVEFDPKYTKIVQHCLGWTVICNDEQTAKVVAYQLKYRAITLDGDLIDSDGIMQGGHRPNVGELISVCQNLRNVFAEEREVRLELQQLEAKLDHFNRETVLLNEYERAQRTLKNVTDLRQCTAYAALNLEIMQLKEMMEQRSVKIKGWADEMAVWTIEQKALTEKLDHFEENKARSMKATQSLIQKWTKALEAANKKYDAKQNTFKEIELELASKEAIITNCVQDIEQAKKDLAEAEVEHKKKKMLLDEVTSLFQAKDADYEDAVKEAQLLDDQLAQLASDIENLHQEIQTLELRKMTRDNTSKGLKESIKSLKAILDGLKKKYSSLDFSDAVNRKRPRRKLADLKAELDAKEKELEEKRLRLDYASAGKAEESQAKLMTALERIAQVAKNRLLIQDAIDILDVQKMQLVNNAFESINKEFGAMMKTLLPESEAKLVPVKPGDLECGVNIHVCLGGVWKESLSELSGGQRSLVALALVLSLCLFCPAPFYVLDEVDAALDLSHTQNIGVIIQQRFKDTQFICVSLKDGMYSNANTLFQTSFTNGKSAVTCSKTFKIR